MSKEEKDKIKEYQRERYQQLIYYKKEALLNNWVLLLFSINMREKTLKFDNIRIDEKEFHESKQPINLDLVNVDQIVISDKLQHNDDGFRYFIGHKKTILLNRHVLSYLKWVDTWNTLKTQDKTCFS